MSTDFTILRLVISTLNVCWSALFVVLISGVLVVTVTVFGIVHDAFIGHFTIASKLKYGISGHFHVATIELSVGDVK